MLDFTKMQATGNDFVVIEDEQDARDWSKLAREMCDRHFGVGADGLLLVLPSSRADLRMRVFNSDGSEAEACGNGTRCVVRYAVGHGVVPAGRKTLTIETLAGVRQVGLLPGGDVEVGMGAPRFRPEEIPLRPGQYGAVPIVDFPLVVGGRELRLDFVSMGNPHAVCFVREDVAAFPLGQLGPQVEHDALFPQRVNFEIARVLAPGRIQARIWERGVGETLSCGSGACAIAVAARNRGSGGDMSDIIVPGGAVHIAWRGHGDVCLSGPAEAAFRGSWASTD